MGESYLYMVVPSPSNSFLLLLVLSHWNSNGFKPLNVNMFSGSEINVGINTSFHYGIFRLRVSSITTPLFDWIYIVAPFPCWTKYNPLKDFLPKEVHHLKCILNKQIKRVLKQHSWMQSGKTFWRRQTALGSQLQCIPRGVSRIIDCLDGRLNSFIENIIPIHMLRLGSTRR